MMDDKRKYLIFILILIAFASIGGVSANTQENTTGIADDVVLVETVLVDETSYSTTEPIMGSNEVTSDFSNVSNTLYSDNVFTSSPEESCDILVLDDDSDYSVNSPVINPDFEDGLNGWTVYGASITDFFINAKSGTKFVSLSTDAYISQSFNFDTVDSVSFWYMSNTKDSTINIFIDGIFLDKYTIQKTGLGKKRWEEVKINLSNFTGYHTLNISQQYGSGYLDYFNCNYNDYIVANFTISSWNISDGYITIDFDDLSQGLISNYIWDFGDGNISTEQNPKHTFKLDYYTIKLTVENENVMDSFNYTLPISLPTIERSNIGYSTIQEAINNAIDGDVINVTSNYFTDEYFGNLVVDKSLTLDFNNCTVKSKNNNPIIHAVNGANVTVKNLRLSGNSSNIFSTDINSKFIFDCDISDVEFTFSEGNILLNQHCFNNVSIFTMANAQISNCNFAGSTININDGETIIINNTFSSCDVAIKQNGGKLNITNNIIKENNVGISILSGVSDIHFNSIYSNNNVSLVYIGDNVDYSNNWWGLNNPTFSYGNIGDYVDVYRADNIKSSMDSWLVLNVTQHDLSVDKWVGGITYYNLTVDLTHNNLGEDTSVLGHLWNKNYTFSFNDVARNIFLENGFEQLIFTFGYLTGDVDKIVIKFDNENYELFIDVDDIAPVITYITPTSSFDDELNITIVCNDPEAVIFYTLDGSNPCSSNTRLIYDGTFTIDNAATVHYTAIDKMGNRPLFSLGTNRLYLVSEKIYSDVFVECSPKNKVWYTTDGSAPDDINNPNRIKYSHMFYVDEPTKFLFTCINGYFTGSNDPVYGTVAVTTYTDSFSVNYLKNTVNNQSSDAVWSQYHGNINNSGVTHYIGPNTNLTKWSNDITTSGSAVIDKKGHIYIGGDDGYLYCFNNQGLVIWRFGTTSKIISTPMIGNDGNIYFSNWMNSSIYCISPNGELIWKYNLGDYNTGSSIKIANDGSVYAITSSNFSSNIYSLKDGVLLWNCSIPLIGGSTPAIGLDGTIYLISEDHEFIAVNPDGTLKYKKDLLFHHDIEDYLKESKVSASIGDDGTIFVINQPHYKNNHNSAIVSRFLQAFYSNGTIKWMIEYGQFFAYGTPTYYKGILYVSCENELLAVNASNGNILWSKSINYAPYSASSPLISGNDIMYLARGNIVYAFDLEGNQLWNYTLTGKYGDPNCLSSSTLSDDGTLIVTTNQGIFAFNDIAAEFKYIHVDNTETTIQFTDLSVKGNNSYFWDFGDGEYSIEQNPIHVYNSSGKYRVVLIVEYNGISLARNTTIDVVMYDLTPPSNVSNYIDGIESNGGVFIHSQNVTLVASDDEGPVIIYYTVDGSSPVNSSTRRIYYEPISIESDTVLKSVAVDEYGNYGNVSTVFFKINDALNINDLINSTLIQAIQELLDSAEEGSKFIFDYDVLYGVNFTIKKPLNIITTNNTRLIGNGNQPILTFTESAKGSSINGFIFEDNGVDSIFVENTSDIIVKNSVISSNASNGIHIFNSKNILIKDTLVNNSNNGIFIEKSSDIKLNHVEIDDCYSNGVWVYQSQNTVISNSLFEDNGKDPYKLNYGDNQLLLDSRGRLTFNAVIPASQSKATQILIENSQRTELYNNTLNHGYFGVRLYHKNDNVVMDNNTFYEGVGDAILLSNSYSNVNITHNLINGCYNGINFMGYSNNVTIKQNTIENLHQHENDLQDFKIESLIYELADYVYEYHFPHDQFFNHCYNGIQISHGASNVHEGNTIMIDNVIIKLQHRAWESRKYHGYLDGGCAGYGYNLYDGSSSYDGSGGATSYREGKVDLVVDRVGDSSFRLRLINRLDGHYLSEIPEFDVTFIAGGFSQTVQFKDSEAVATFDTASAITTVVAKISTEVQKSAAFDIEITEGFNSSNRESDPGYEAGEAINNPDPVIPSMDELINKYIKNNNPNKPAVNPHEDYPEKVDVGLGNGTGNGNGHGSGTGTGTGNGSGSQGFIGNGKVNVQSNNTEHLNSGDYPNIGEAMDRSSEGGSDAGSGETVNAYEVTKVINIDENNWKFVVAVILFALIIILGYGYRRGKDDGDEF